MPRRTGNQALGTPPPSGAAALRLARPVEVAPPATAWRVRAVIPCFNRRADAELLLNDLAALAAAEPTVDLRVLLVDNASEEPLLTLPIPVGVRLEHLRLEVNTGGSGGFNAGMARVLSCGIPADAREFIWLLDSDARVSPATLRPLVRTLEVHDDIVAVGSALADETGEVFEVGGRVCPRTGEWSAAPRAARDEPPVVRVEYAAACSLLVRRWAVERAGLMADAFVGGDDVEWCLRLARATGGAVAVAPRSIARHPRYDRMRTWSRYYAARNTFLPIAALGLGPMVRFRRAMREVGRALAQVMVGRDDLAELHLRGLADAADGRTSGPGVGLVYERFRRLDSLGADLKANLSGHRVRRVTLGRDLGVEPDPIVKQLRKLALDPTIRPPSVKSAWTAKAVRGGLWRLFKRPAADAAIVSARARPEDWLAAPTLITVCPEGFVIRRVGRADRWRRAATVATRGLAVAVRLARRPPQRPAPAEPPAPTAVSTISIVVVSHNRRDALGRTLTRLADEFGATSADAPRSPEIIVVDNASTDGTPEHLAAEFPGVRVARLEENLGVAAYNVGVGLATGDLVLVLDDDSWPEPGVVGHAARLLDRRPDVAAVAFHPRHPATDASEWGFSEGVEPDDRWPFMGCGNLVRREAWRRVGGYEAAYFLYRNDTDLALKLLAAGMGVHFNPAWVVRHDSPAAARKSARWCELATRNWFWTARRHGRGLTKLAAITSGWAWAHRLARWSPASHVAVIRGAAAGLVRRPPPLPEGRGVRRDGAAFQRLLRLKRGRR